MGLRKSVRFFGLLWIAVLCSNFSGAQQQNSAITSIRTVHEVLEKTSLEYAFALLLMNTGLPGGIATAGGCQPELFDFNIPPGMELPQALDALIAAQKTHSWTLIKGAVVLLPRLTPQLLQTRISNIRITDINNLNLAVDELTKAKRVDETRAALGLVWASPEIGFYSLRPKEPRPLVLTDVTLLDALTEIANQHGRTIWRYSESTCNGRKSARL